VEQCLKKEMAGRAGDINAGGKKKEKTETHGWGEDKNNVGVNNRNKKWGKGLDRRGKKGEKATPTETE